MKRPYSIVISLLRLHFIFPLGSMFPPMAGKERQQKNNQGNYTADIWGNQLEQQAGGRRRGKSKTVLINGIPHVQQTLFSGKELRPPFPNAPINKVPDHVGMTAEPGTLFSRLEPEPQGNQNDLFNSDEATTKSPVAMTRQREDPREYQPLHMPLYHLLILDDKKQIHFVPSILRSFDSTWNVIELQPLYEARSTNREEAERRLTEEPDFQGSINDVQVFVRPDEETRVKTAPLTYMHFITTATQGQEQVYLTGEVQPSRLDDELVTFVGYSAAITSDQRQAYQHMQDQLRRSALIEEQPVEEDRPVLRRFLRAMRGDTHAKPTGSATREIDLPTYRL